MSTKGKHKERIKELEGLFEAIEDTGKKIEIFLVLQNDIRKKLKAEKAEFQLTLRKLQDLVPVFDGKSPGDSAGDVPYRMCCSTTYQDLNLLKQALKAKDRL